MPHSEDDEVIRHAGSDELQHTSRFPESALIQVETDTDLADGD